MEINPVENSWKVNNIKQTSRISMQNYHKS